MLFTTKELQEKCQNLHIQTFCINGQNVYLTGSHGRFFQQGGWRLASNFDLLDVWIKLLNGSCWRHLGKSFTLKKTSHIFSHDLHSGEPFV